MLVQNLDMDWYVVQCVHAGEPSNSCVTASDYMSWRCSEPQPKDTSTTFPPERIELTQNTVLPFPNPTDARDAGFQTNPKLQSRTLKDRSVSIPAGVFTDKYLPPASCPLVLREQFTGDYFVSLHNIVASAGRREDGSTYEAFTPNYLGARIKLVHTGLRLDKWRLHLIGYEHAEIVQFIEYGFPLGLCELPSLESSTRNHGSAYGYYEYVDRFITEELVNGGVTGPFNRVPWLDSIISPLMTAPKKPDSRRTVFDATFGEKSLNNSTPSDFYLGQPCTYTFPKIDDFRKLVLGCGTNSYMWKRDLSRFFLQIPVDPSEYHRLCLVWRGLFFFFLGLAFGLRHSGLQGQRLTDAVSWIHRRRGLETQEERMFNVVNYSDDLGGVESTKSRANESFLLMSSLFQDLGLDESVKKAEAPSTQMVYLGVMFDTVAMEMRVPPDKLTELKAEIKTWVRKTTITKKGLQSLLGKLFWVSKVVRYARAFIGRLLQQLRSLASTKDHIKVKLTVESRKDLVWWSSYLEHFNGIQMIINEDPFLLTLDQMMDRPLEVCAGDATPMGGGAWHGHYFWCRELPAHLQDPGIPIHLKEFWVVIVSARLWGDSWSGKCITIWCDNDAVVDTVTHRKPRDPSLLSLLREFLYLVVTKKFFPVLRKIDTKDNFLADFISRRHDNRAAIAEFEKVGLYDMKEVSVPDCSFKLTEPW